MCDPEKPLHCGGRSGSPGVFMRTRYFVLVVLVLVLLGGFAGGVYAYDKARADQIADGVTVGGIPIGGLTPIEARPKLHQQILQPLRRPLVIRYGKTKWRLTARKAKLRTDL